MVTVVMANGEEFSVSDSQAQAIMNAWQSGKPMVSLGDGTYLNSGQIAIIRGAGAYQNV